MLVRPQLVIRTGVNCIGAMPLFAMAFLPDLELSIAYAKKERFKVVLFTVQFVP